MLLRWLWKQAWPIGSGATDHNLHRGPVKSEATPTRRKFWRIHLLTAALLMFACGGVLWANLRAYEFYVDSGFQANRAWGWPFPWLIWMHFPDGSDSQPPLFLGLVLNIAVVMPILAIVTLVSELILRRGEKSNDTACAI